MCIWRCEHANLVWKLFYAPYINFHSFIHSFIHSFRLEVDGTCLCVEYGFPSVGGGDICPWPRGGFLSVIIIMIIKNKKQTKNNNYKKIKK